MGRVGERLNMGSTRITGGADLVLILGTPVVSKGTDYFPVKWTGCLRFYLVLAIPLTLTVLEGGIGGPLPGE